MNLLQYALALMSGFLIFSVTLLVLALTFLYPTSTEERLLRIVQSKREEQLTEGVWQYFESRLLNVARSMRRKLGIDVGKKSLERLQSAGYRRANDPDLFFSAQWIMPILGLFAGSFAPKDTLFWSFVGTTVGYLVPNLWISREIAKRRERIRRSLPDALDLLVICVDAGLGLDQALLRVGEELALSHPDINEEFTQVNLEQRAGKPRLEAWQSLSDRTKIEEFAAFTSMLTQTDRFGTPIIKSLSRFAEEIRMKRRQHAEEM